MNNTLSVERISKELKLIFELLKDDNNCYILQNQKELFQDINWNLFIELALHHRIFPLLPSKLKLVDEKFLPAFVPETIETHYKRNIFRMLQLTGEMELINKRFSECGIKTIFLKGPVLAEELYGDISLRTSTDLDFLVPIECLEESENLLESQGYVKKDFICSVLNDWKWRHSNAIFIHSEKNTKIELHWRLHPGPGQEPAFEDLWARSMVSSLTGIGSSFRILGREDLLLFLTYHGARHGWSRIRWLVDIQKILKQEIDWPILKSIVSTHQSKLVLGQATILSSYLLGSKVREELVPFAKMKKSIKLANDALFYLETIVNIHLEPVPENIANYHKRHLYSLMSKRNKFLFRLSFLYPYSEDAATLPLPHKLHILYFPLRPFLWAWRKTRGQPLS